jgi:hypothetical protein
MMARVLCVCVSLPRAWTSIYTHTGREILFKLINLARAGGGLVSRLICPPAQHINLDEMSVTFRDAFSLFSHQLKIKK